MKEEHVQVDQILGHGGLFKTKGVGQKILAGASTHRFPSWRQQERAEPGASRCWLLI